MKVNGVVEEIFLKKMEEYGDWKNALLSGMTLDHFMYMGVLYPTVEETVLPSVSTVSTVSTQTCIISINTHVERIGKRRYSKKSLLDSRSRRKSFRNPKHVDDYYVDYFTEEDEINLYRLGLVLISKSENDEDVISRLVSGQDIEKHTRKLVYEKRINVERKIKTIKKIEKLFKNTFKDVDIENENVDIEIKKYFFENIVEVKYFHPGYILYTGEMNKSYNRDSSYCENVCFKFNGIHRRIHVENISYISSIRIDITELFTPTKSRTHPRCKWGILDDVRHFKKFFTNDTTFPALQTVFFDLYRNFSQYHLRMIIVHLHQIFPNVRIVVNITKTLRIEKTRNIRTLERTVVNLV